jgi:hypothetical protein
MYRKKDMKKNIITGASILVILILCSNPITGFILINDPLIINPGGPYIAFVNETKIFHFSIVGGIPPFRWIINWGDGTNDTRIMPDRFLELTNTYIRTGDFTITIFVRDSKGNKDIAQTHVNVIKIESDLGISISSREIIYTEREKVQLEITITSFSQQFTCDDCHVNITIRPGYYPINIICPEIGPESTWEVIKRMSLPTRFDIYTATAVLHSDCNDPNPNNNVDSCSFFVFPHWFYNIIQDIPDLLNDIIDEFDLQS